MRSIRIFALPFAISPVGEKVAKFAWDKFVTKIFDRGPVLGSAVCVESTFAAPPVRIILAGLAPTGSVFRLTNVADTHESYLPLTQDEPCPKIA